jgi:hypothetical protein
MCARVRHRVGAELLQPTASLIACQAIGRTVSRGRCRFCGQSPRRGRGSNRDHPVLYARWLVAGQPKACRGYRIRRDPLQHRPPRETAPPVQLGAFLAIPRAQRNCRIGNWVCSVPRANWSIRIPALSRERRPIERRAWRRARQFGEWRFSSCGAERALQLQCLIGALSISLFVAIKCAVGAKRRGRWQAPLSLVAALQLLAGTRGLFVWQRRHGTR